jgi:hypothetical protein
MRVGDMRVSPTTQLSPHDGDSMMATIKRSRRGGVDDISTATRRLNAQLREDSYERLLIHCVKARMEPGQYVSNLIDDHCKTWRVQVNSVVRSVGDDRLDPAGDVSDDGPIAA